MEIKVILKDINYENYFGDNNIEIKHITCDSKKVLEGDMFVAIKGFTADGHKFIKDAIKSGASVIMCEYIPDDVVEKSNFLLVKSSRASMAAVANIIYNKPSEKINIIGITGTNGKTSTTYLLKGIYDCLGEKTGIVGTMGTIIDDEKIKISNTTPESCDLQYFFSKMVERNVEHCFIEVSSHAMELNRVDDVSIDVGIFTNLTRDHLDFHKTMENYYLAKKKLFYKTKINNIINVDDSYGKRLYEELINDNVPAISYAIENEADIKASNLVTTMIGTSFDLKINGNTKKMHVNTPGKFSVLNSLGALGAAYALGVNVDNIIEALSVIKGVKGRFEIIENNLDCTIILDFAHTADGLEKVLETINEFAQGRKTVLYGAGGERDISRRAPMGEVAAKYGCISILTSDNPRFEDPYDICMEIAKGVLKYKGDYKIIIDREDAIYYAIDNSRSKDVILLAGKSTEPYQDMGVEKIPYDEGTIAKRAIKQIEKKRGLNIKE